ncbi:MAG: 1-deoxy-D-xylulose-5-phosphate synthase [Oscillospiraceae bacterium]|nr:1-deoxy-D-xylulose-5-phosphate synthase [Oscillospiraceae bacterium]
MTVPQLKQLCKELRGCILHTTIKNGGHLSSNLGVVELTVALHSVFDVNGGDKILWDVGHQSYAHKLLTGRYSRFDTLRRKGGVSGFQRPEESSADAFVSGHSSTSVSAAYGISEAMRLRGENGAVAAVVGDGALTGGMVYEALNNAGKTASNLTLVLNDNAMSISKNKGALARYLAHIRSTKKYYRAKENVKTALSAVPLLGKPLEEFITDAKRLLKQTLYNSSNMFENLGFTYIGPVNGHNLEDLIEALSVAKYVNRPCIVHVFTQKGKGFKPAEENPGKYHAISKGGAAVEYNSDELFAPRTYSEAFGQELVRIGKKDKRVCAITAAMKYAVGLNYFKDFFPARFYDAGIAEQHSVTFAAGLSAGGMLPVFAVYSTFLQRGFDQIIHDCAIENTHITLAVDRAGFVGEDGETHQGIFDVPMLRSIPNTTIFSPASFDELRICLDRAIYDTEGIAAVRYPKGSEFSEIPERFKGSLAPVCDFYYSGKNSAVLAVTYGRASLNCAEACEKSGADLLRLVKINPLPDEIVGIAKKYDRVVFFEEGSKNGGVGENLAVELMGAECNTSVEIVAVNGGFVPAATVEEQFEMYGLSVGKMTERLNKK